MMTCVASLDNCAGIDGLSGDCFNAFKPENAVSHNVVFKHTPVGASRCRSRHCGCPSFNAHFDFLVTVYFILLSSSTMPGPAADLLVAFSAQHGTQKQQSRCIALLSCHPNSCPTATQAKLISVTGNGYTVSNRQVVTSLTGKTYLNVTFPIGTCNASNTRCGCCVPNADMCICTCTFQSAYSAFVLWCFAFLWWWVTSLLSTYVCTNKL